MPTEFKIPELGENVTSGDVVRVLVKPGDTVAKDQPLLELETDKATGEITGIQPKARKDENEYRWGWDSPLQTSIHKKGRIYFAANKVFRSDDYGSTWQVISGDVTRNMDRNKLPLMGKVWGIDHGLTFNREPKLRTVLWQFVGEPISPPLRRELMDLQGRSQELRETLEGVIDRREIEALLERISRFAIHGCYPALNPRRNVPYGWW